MSKRSRHTTMIVKVALLHKSLDDANPDVGMGPSFAELIRRAESTLEIDKTEYDFEEAVRMLARRR